MCRSVVSIVIRVDHVVIRLVVHLEVCLSQLAVVLIFIVLPRRRLLLLMHQECAFMLIHHLSKDSQLIIGHEHATGFKLGRVGGWQNLIFVGETSSQMFSFARLVVRGAATGASALVKGLGVRIVVVGLIDLVMIFVLAVILFLLFLVVLN